MKFSYVLFWMQVFEFLFILLKIILKVSISIGSGNGLASNRQESLSDLSDDSVQHIDATRPEWAIFIWLKASKCCIKTVLEQ